LRVAISQLDQNCSLWRTCVGISRGVGVRNIGVPGGKKLLQVEIAIRDISKEGSCGPHPDLVGDRWWNIRDREKGSPESFDIRIHDPTNFDFPTVKGDHRERASCGYRKFPIRDLKRQYNSSGRGKRRP